MKYYWKFDVNISRIESRPSKRRDSHTFEIFTDVNGQRGEDRVDRLLASLQPCVQSMLVLDEKEVPW